MSKSKAFERFTMDADNVTIKMWWTDPLSILFHWENYIQVELKVIQQSHNDHLTYLKAESILVSGQQTQWPQIEM